MCLAVPSKIIELNDIMATVEVYGARKDISLMLMPESVQMGDFVLVHAGFAIQKVTQEVAEEAYRLIQEMSEKLDEAGYEDGEEFC